MDEKLLEPPCRCCGYQGDEYWLILSHRAGCPWRYIGGISARKAVIERFEEKEEKSEDS